VRTSSSRTLAPIARGSRAEEIPMKKSPFRLQGLALALGLALASGARAEVRVLACEPAWAAVVREIGGDRVSVDSATTPQQDPHYIQARPSLIARVRQADLLVCSGADLEVGWLPVLLRQGANARLAAGELGNLDVSKLVRMLEVPTSLDRAQGDVHPYGNPHTETDPRNIARVADEVARRLAALDPAGAASYQARRDEFSTRWTAAIAGWERKAAPLRGMEIVTHHVAWAYLVSWLGLVDVAHLEPKPGIPPSASSLARLLETLSAHHPRAVVRLAYEPERPSAWLSERLSIPALVLPHAPGATPAAKDLFAVFDDLIDQLLKAAQ
jgi:zinc/manganese transport system substrate-binding protein